MAQMGLAGSEEDLIQLFNNLDITLLRYGVEISDEKTKRVTDEQPRWHLIQFHNK